MNEENETGRVHCGTTQKDRKNQLRIIAWGLAWVLPFLAATFAIKNEWIGNGAPAFVATIAVTLLGCGMLLAYRKFLREADELRRKVELDSLAITVGVGTVAGFSYSMLKIAGIVAETDVLHLVMIMQLTYVVGIVVGLRRYA